MTILVRNLPPIVASASCPLFDVRVIGRSGDTLVVSSYDVITRSKIGEDVTKSIDSDDFTTTSYAPTPKISGVTIINVLIYVKDSNGNVVEAINRYVLFAPNVTWVDIDKDTEAWYISKLGFVFKVRWEASKYSSVPVPNSNLFYTILHQEGRLMFFEGSTKKLDVSGDSAIVNLTFMINREVATALASKIDDPLINSAIFKVPDLAPIVGGFRAVEEVYESKRFTPLAVSFSYDDNYVYFKVTTQLDLKTPIDIWSTLRIVAGVGAIIAGVVLLVASCGAGAPASALLIASGLSSIGAGAIVLHDTFVHAPKDILEKARNEVESAKNDINMTYEKLNEYVNQLINEGKLTPEEGNRILKYVDMIRSRAFKAFDELYKSVQDAYRRGYEDGVNSAKWWVLGAGAGGCVLGFVIGKK